MFILDTNVVSELRKSRTGKANKNVVRWARNVAASEIYLSVITVQELETGVMRAERRDPAKGAMLRSWFDNNVLPAFEGRILPIDTTVARRSAKLHVPDPRPVLDALIAATALVHGMTLVTRNTGDFAQTGVQIVNPWTAA